jgi:hypothetical protein
MLAGAPVERFIPADVRAVFTNCCHCLNCQRQTGSAFVINLLIEADRVELLAGDPGGVDVPPRRRQQPADLPLSGPSRGGLQRAGRPEVRFVRAGTLDEPSSVTPDAHIFRGQAQLGRASESTPLEVYYDRRPSGRPASLERLDAALGR